MKEKAKKKNQSGYFGDFGGRYAPEILTEALEELETTYKDAKKDPKFWKELDFLFKNYVGRPSLLYFAEKLTKQWGGARVWLKREDLNHTGAHKINNAIGQMLLARRMGKRKVIAETGAGQHGLATATAAALLDMEATILMGEEDLRRQELNAIKMKMLGAQIRPVTSGTKTLKDAASEAMREWALSVKETHYVVGSVFGPHPFPTIVRDFQSVIGKETKKQFQKARKKLPDAIVACAGGGSNAMGIFHHFVGEKKTRLIAVEAGGKGGRPGEHSAALTLGTMGYLHGTRTLIIQDEHGQILPAHSISAGLDYPGVGPELSYLAKSGRVESYSISDNDAIEGFLEMCKLEGIIPALETSHAIQYAKGLAKQMGKKKDLVICLSGRGDKDAAEVARLKGEI